MTIETLYLPLLGLLAVAIVTDVRARLIPNALPLIACAIFVPAAFFGLVPNWPLHLLVFVGTFVVCLGLFAGNVMGGGDAKLIPAVALWAGPQHLPTFIAVMAVTGGVLALGLLCAAKLRRASRTQAGTVSVPYAVAIAAGGAAFLAEPTINYFTAMFAGFLVNGGLNSAS